MFDEKAKCFIDQYNQFKVIGPNDEEANVNGKVSILDLFNHYAQAHNNGSLYV